MRGDPRLGGRAEGGGVGGEGVDEALGGGLGSAEHLALEEDLEGGLQPDDPWQALGAAAAGEEAEGGLWQADEDAGVVDGDAVVTRQRQLVAPTECGAGDARDHGQAAGLGACAG